MVKRNYLVILLLFVSLFTFAQKKGYVNISGTVYDATTHKPIENAVVVIGHKNAITDTNGKYFLKNIYKNLTLIKVTRLGYSVDSKKVDLRQKKNYKYNFYLSEKDNSLNEVVVTGTRTQKTLANTPVLTKVISAKDIMETGSTSAFDALQNIIPGIQFNPDPHGANMSIQGLSNSYILVLVDGERLIGEVRGNVNLERISAENIKKIEIINGASSVLYGSNAIGGVINIITKNPKNRIEGNVSTRYATFNTLNTDVNLGVKRNKYSAQVNFFRNSSDGYDLTPESPAQFTADRYEDYSLGTKLRFTPNEDMKITANLTGFRHEVFHPKKSLSRVHKLNQNYTVGGKFEHKLGEKQSVVFGFNTDIFNSYTVLEKRDNKRNKNSDFQFTKFDFAHNIHINDDLNFINGGEFNLEKMYSKTLFGNNNRKRKSNDINLFTQADWKVIKNLELVAGARYTHHSTFGNHFTPKLSAMYSFPHLKVRATGGLGYKSPSLRDLYYNFDHGGMFWIYGNENLKPENSKYISLSTEYTYRSLNVSLNGYYNQVSNKINQVSVVNKTTGKYEFVTKNIDEVEVKGFETNVNWRFFSHFKFKAGYVYSDAKDKSTGLQVFGNSKHTGTTALTFDVQNIRYPLSLTLLGRIASARIYQVREKDKTTGKEIITSKNTDPYSFWRCTYIQKIPLVKGVYSELKLGVNNIFNYTDIDSSLLSSRRTYWGSLSIRF